jgi:6-phosphogluconolactonase/glucosamine-6-phosphate isomerase/deaminase
MTNSEYKDIHDFFISILKDSINAEKLTDHSYNLGIATGIKCALSLEERINEEQKKEMDSEIQKAIDTYWNQAHADLESAHKRIF